MAVGEWNAKQSPVKVFQFASKFVVYSDLRSVLGVEHAYFQVQSHFALSVYFFSVLNFENAVNFSMDSKAKFPDIHANPLIREIISCILSTFQNNRQYFRSATSFDCKYCRVCVS